MELKCTLQYSNPHVIRQIAVPEKITLQQLYRVICVCADMDTLGVDTLFFKDGVQLKKTQQVDEIMLSESVPDSEKMLSCIVKKNDKVCWEWRIELVSKENRLSDEKTVQYPILLRFQGTNIGNGRKEVAEFNRYSNSWYSLQDLQVQKQSVNLKLNLLFSEFGVSKENHASGKKGIELDSSTLLQMKSCLDSLKQMRVDELKEIEKNLDMNHPTNIQKEKRAELILQDYIEKTDVMLHIFEQISLTEFDVFLKLYASGGTVSRSIEDCLEYKTLEKYGLVSIDVDYSGSITVDMSIELAMGAGKFMKEPEKSSLRNFQVVQAVIAACVNLYGFASYWHYSALIDANYKKIIAQEAKKQYWDMFAERAKEGRWRYMWSSVSNVFFKPTSDQDWIIQQVKKNFEEIPYYIPGGEEIKLLQRDGIDYSLPGYKMFFSVLVDNCRSFEDENKLVTEMMLKCINGESPRKVVYNYRHCFIKGTASVKILGDALEKLEATIRRPQYYGHTKNEFMRLTGGITK